MITLEHAGYRTAPDGQFLLKNVNLSIRSGEFILVTGRSGSGKTTLLRLINGIIPQMSDGLMEGEVVLPGGSTRLMKIKELAQTVGTVFQDPRSQFFTTQSTAELAFGCENMEMPPAVIRERLDETFSIFSMEKLRDRSLFSLSSGEKQLVALASTYMLRPLVYVLDEPSANLDMRAAQRMGEVLRELKARGSTIIIAEHRLYYLTGLVDRMIYMEQGEIAAIYEGREAEAFEGERLEQMGLRRFHLTDVANERQVRHFSSATEEKQGGEGIRLENVHFAYRRQEPVLRGVNLHIRTGEIVGLIGHNGAGKTTLSKTICGLLKETQGSISLHGVPLSRKKRRRACYFVMQDADYQLFAESVEEELKLGNEHIPELDRLTVQALDRLGLASFKDRHPAALSGGQKQRVTIAVPLVGGSEVLLFDEPTSGLDADHMQRVSEWLHDLAEQGKIVIVISHDFEFLVQACSRIVHLEHGTIADDFPLLPTSLPELRHLLSGHTHESEEG